MDAEDAPGYTGYTGGVSDWMLGHRGKSPMKRVVPISQVKIGVWQKLPHTPQRSGRSQRSSKPCERNSMATVLPSVRPIRTRCRAASGCKNRRLLGSLRTSSGPVIASYPGAHPVLSHACRPRGMKKIPASGSGCGGSRRAHKVAHAPILVGAAIKYIGMLFARSAARHVFQIVV